MKITARFVSSIGAALGVAGMLALMAPKAVHAVTAALVQVANPPSSPVPNQDVDQPARHPFVLSCQTLISNEGLCTTRSVPPNSEFVIQAASVALFGAAGVVDFASSEGGVTQTTFLPMSVQPPGLDFVSTVPVAAYADSNTQVTCTGVLGQGANSAQMNCTFNGYLISLP